MAETLPQIPDPRNRLAQLFVQMQDLAAVIPAWDVPPLRPVGPAVGSDFEAKFDNIPV